MSDQSAEVSRRLLRHPMVIVEKSTESVAATNAACVPRWTHRIDEFVADTLVISLVMVMLD